MQARSVRGGGREGGGRVRHGEDGPFSAPASRAGARSGGRSPGPFDAASGGRGAAGRPLGDGASGRSGAGCREGGSRSGPPLELFLGGLPRSGGPGSLAGVADAPGG